jgi:hypothetical protein
MQEHDHRPFARVVHDELDPVRRDATPSRKVVGQHLMHAGSRAWPD